VLHDEDLAAAILDRILERGRFIKLDGPSWRTRHLSLEELVPSQSEGVRISEINGTHSDYRQLGEVRGAPSEASGINRVLVPGCQLDAAIRSPQDLSLKSGILARFCCQSAFR